jgi:prevent-host-death family protein
LLATDLGTIRTELAARREHCRRTLGARSRRPKWELPFAAESWSAAVKTMTANDARTRFGELLDLAQRAPVRVTRRQRVVAVLVSAPDYEAMRAFYADRLRRTLRECASDGVTDEQLADLLADDS